MTTTLEAVGREPKPTSGEADAAQELVRLAREQGIALTGLDGLLKQFTKAVLETALTEEMTEHLGHQKNRAPADRQGGNVRNATRPKTVLTEATGEVTIEVPRNRDGTFTPVIVPKRKRRLTGVDEMVLSLYAKGWPPPRPRRISPRCTGRRCPRKRSPGSPTRSSRRCSLGSPAHRPRRQPGRRCAACAGWSRSLWQPCTAAASPTTPPSPPTRSSPASCWATCCSGVQQGRRHQPHRGQQPRPAIPANSPGRVPATAPSASTAV